MYLTVVFLYYGMVDATVKHFTENMSKLPANRQEIKAVGPYIVELYTDIMFEEETGVKARIEINKQQESGSIEYQKQISLQYTSLSEANTQFEKLHNETEIKTVIKEQQ